MKVLISSCVLGNEVRWNKQGKLNSEVVEWAEQNDIELIPVCPENELLGTPRDKIRLIQIEEKTCAHYKNRDIMEELKSKCQEILERYPDASGFIGIYGSPTCGISVGVKNLGSVTKGVMHKQCQMPTVESNALRNENNREIFLRRLSNETRRSRKIQALPQQSSGSQGSCGSP